MNIWPWSKFRRLESCLTDMIKANATLNGRLEQWENFHQRLEQLMVQNKVTNLAVARIVAKIDPQYGRSDFDPERRKESDELSNEIIRKLIVEHRAAQTPEGSF